MVISGKPGIQVVHLGRLLMRAIRLLSCNTTYYHGLKVRLQRIEGIDIFHDQDNGTDGPNSYTKLYEMYGSIRWLISLDGRTAIIGAMSQT